MPDENIIRPTHNTLPTKETNTENRILITESLPQMNRNICIVSNMGNIVHVRIPINIRSRKYCLNVRLILILSIRRNITKLKKKI